MTGRPGKPRPEQDQIGGRSRRLAPVLGYRSLEAPGNRRRRQMVTIPQGIQNPAYSPPSAHIPGFEYEMQVRFEPGEDSLQETQGG